MWMRNRRRRTNRRNRPARGSWNAPGSTLAKWKAMPPEGREVWNDNRTSRGMIWTRRRHLPERNRPDAPAIAFRPANGPWPVSKKRTTAMVVLLPKQRRPSRRRRSGPPKVVRRPTPNNRNRLVSRYTRDENNNNNNSKMASSPNTKPSCRQSYWWMLCRATKSPRVKYTPGTNT
jgi:hypothetical protein